MNQEFRERLGEGVLLAAGVIGLIIGKDFRPAAITLPLTKEGIIFYLDEKTPQLETHEENHRKQIQEMGQLGFLEYYLDDWCRAETDAGAYTSHPNCSYQRNFRKFQNRINGVKEPQVVFSTRR